MNSADPLAKIITQIVRQLRLASPSCGATETQWTLLSVATFSTPIQTNRQTEMSSSRFGCDEVDARKDALKVQLPAADEYGGAAAQDQNN